MFEKQTVTSVSTVGILGRKKLGMMSKRTSSPEIRAISQQHLQTIGNTQILEKQMDFTSIGILLIDFLFFYVNGNISQLAY